jgi:hypothetical protein
LIADLGWVFSLLEEAIGVCGAKGKRHKINKNRIEFKPKLETYQHMMIYKGSSFDKVCWECRYDKIKSEVTV